MAGRDVNLLALILSIVAMRQKLGLSTAIFPNARPALSQF